MSKYTKAVERLKARPKDFTWSELQTIMRHLGYFEKKGSSSRRKFINNTTGAVVALHEPHPDPKIKSYALEIIIDHLTEEKLI